MPWAARLFVGPGEEARLALVVFDLLDVASDLRVAVPAGWVDRGAVEGEARVASEIERLAGVPHGAEPELTVGDLRLRAAYPWRPVASQCRDGLVDTAVEEGPRALAELAFRLDDVSP